LDNHENDKNRATISARFALYNLPGWLKIHSNIADAAVIGCQCNVHNVLVTVRHNFYDCMATMTVWLA